MLVHSTYIVKIAFLSNFITRRDGFVFTAYDNRILINESLNGENLSENCSELTYRIRLNEVFD